MPKLLNTRKNEKNSKNALKEKYGSDAEEDGDEESDEESDESEDEDGEELTPAVDAAILRTLARIKRKDPEIYNSKSGIFEGMGSTGGREIYLISHTEEQTKVAPLPTKPKQAKDKSKPVTIRQVALEAALDAGSRSPSPEPRPFTHAEEQQLLRDETIAAFHGDDGEDEGDDFLVPREKTKDEQEQEEEEYRTFLERNVGTDLKDLVTVDPNTISWDAKGDATTSKTVGDEGKKKKKKSKDVNNDKKQSKEEADQDFLMNYIMNRGWIDKTSNRVPTYKEITSSRKAKGKAKAQEDEEGVEAHQSDVDMEDDALPTNDPDVNSDDFDEIVDRFESSYNFRFEEPDADVIKQYPRQIESTVRREDSTRKEARKRKAARKEEEMQKRREEVKRMKALKMKGLRAKLDKIEKEGGRSFPDDPVLQELDLDGDWDPDAHDRQMSGLYGDDAEYDEDDKPTWDDDIDIGDIYVSDDEQPAKSSKKEKKKKKKKNKETTNEGGVDIDDMDADVERVEDDDEWDGTEEMRKRKLDEYMDDIYGLEFNDMVGGMPTRFRYAKVKSDNFALSPVEILLATDQELNEYMSIKKYAPYREGGKWDMKRNERLQELKAKIAQRRGDVASGDHTDEIQRPAKKRKGKKERMKMKILAEPSNSDVTGEGMEVEDTGLSTSAVKQKRPVDQDGGDHEEEKPSKKKRNRHKKDKERASVTNS
ncbi:Kinetochore protein Spc24 [Marasmius tenuissimus]|nr:Kinetochore protein Spc24 [Marasmius tenuissimus]